MVNGKLKGKSDKLMFNQNMFLLENELENHWLSSLMASECESIKLLSYMSHLKRLVYSLQKKEPTPAKYWIICLACAQVKF